MGKRASGSILGLAVLALGLIAPPASGQPPGTVTIRDGFDAPKLDPSIWSTLEAVRRINNGKLESALRRAGSNLDNGLMLTNPNSVNSIQAAVSVLEVSTTGAEPAARIRGTFFNDGTPGGGVSGDVDADLSIRLIGGVLTVTYSVDRCDNADCSLVTAVLPVTTLGTVAQGSTHSLRLSYDGAQTFTFTLDVTNQVYSTPFLRAGVPTSPARSIGTRVTQLDAPGDIGAITATFDDVTVNGVLYDDFASATLDATKWINQEVVFQVTDGALESMVRRFGSNGFLTLVLRQSAVRVLQADVTVVASSNNGGTPHARLLATFYNDGTPGTDSTGDVYGQIFIQDTGNQLRAGYNAFRCLTDICSGPTETVLLVNDPGAFGPVQPGATHRLSLSFNGSEMVFGFDGATASFSPTAAAPVAGPPHGPFAGPSLLVFGAGTPTDGASITARFDNVVAIAAPSPGAGAASVGLDGRPGNGQSVNPTVSQDGRVIAFGSVATNLVTGGCTTSVRQVYVREPASGITTCISVAPDGSPGDGTSSNPALSADGRFVAFVSAATNLAGACTTGTTQVFVRDRVTGTTTCASVGPGGAGDGASALPILSADGRLVAFESTATNLASPCTGAGGAQIFVRDRAAGTTTCVSAAGGAGGAGPSGRPSLSGDGRLVAFHSTASNLAGPCTSGVQQVLVHDRLTGLTTCESLGPGGVPGSASSGAPVLSADGRRLAFLSAAPNLASPCTTGTVQVFVRTRATGATRCVSLGPGGVPGNGSVTAVTLSGNGRVIAFASSAQNLVAKPFGPVAAPVGGAPGAGPDQIFEADLGAPGGADEGSQSLPLAISTSDDGDLGSASSTNPALSFDGEVTSFQSPADNLVPNDTNGTDDVFVATPPRRPTIVAPVSGTQLLLDVPTGLTLAWTTSPGAVQYGVEFTGTNRQFANPNAAAPDPVNGFGGAGGAFVVPVGTTVSALVGSEVPLGSYQVRVIGISATGQAVSGFSNAVTILLGSAQRPTITAPLNGSEALRGTSLTVAWTAVPGATRYGLEFTGTDRQFANPNATGPDPVNGAGGAGGGLLVPGTTLAAVLPGEAPPGRYQIRVIGISPTGIVGTFSDAVTLVIQ